VPALVILPLMVACSSKESSSTTTTMTPTTSQDQPPPEDQKISVNLDTKYFFSYGYGDIATALMEPGTCNSFLVIAQKYEATFSNGHWESFHKAFGRGVYPMQTDVLTMQLKEAWKDPKTQAELRSRLFDEIKSATCPLSSPDDIVLRPAPAPCFTLPKMDGELNGLLEFQGDHDGVCTEAPELTLAFDVSKKVSQQWLQVFAEESFKHGDNINYGYLARATTTFEKTSYPVQIFAHNLDVQTLNLQAFDDPRAQCAQQSYETQSAIFNYAILTPTPESCLKP
jgi:hypothetical protein